MLANKSFLIVFKYVLIAQLIPVAYIFVSKGFKFEKLVCQTFF